jgi:hypothetical protein
MSTRVQQNPKEDKRTRMRHSLEKNQGTTTESGNATDASGQSRSYGYLKYNEGRSNPGDAEITKITKGKHQPWNHNCESSYQWRLQH